MAIFLRKFKEGEVTTQMFRLGYRQLQKLKLAYFCLFRITTLHYPTETTLTSISGIQNYFLVVNFTTIVLVVCVQLKTKYKLKVKEEKEQIFLSEIIQLQENEGRHGILSLLTKEAPSLKPPL